MNNYTGYGVAILVMCVVTLILVLLIANKVGVF